MARTSTTGISVSVSMGTSVGVTSTSTGTAVGADVGAAVAGAAVAVRTAVAAGAPPPDGPAVAVAVAVGVAVGIVVAVGACAQRGPLMVFPFNATVAAFCARIRRFKVAPELIAVVSATLAVTTFPMNAVFEPSVRSEEHTSELQSRLHL